MMCATAGGGDEDGVGDAAGSAVRLTSTRIDVPLG